MRGPTPGRIKNALRRLCKQALGLPPKSAYHAENGRGWLARKLIWWGRGHGARRALRAACAKAREVMPPDRWARVVGWLDAAFAAAPGHVISGYGRSPCPWH